MWYPETWLITSPFFLSSALIVLFHCIYSIQRLVASLFSFSIIDRMFPFRNHESQTNPFGLCRLETWVILPYRHCHSDAWIIHPSCLFFIRWMAFGSLTHPFLPMLYYWLNGAGGSLIQKILLGFVQTVALWSVTHPYVLSSVICRYCHLFLQEWHPWACIIHLSRL